MQDDAAVRAEQRASGAAPAAADAVSGEKRPASAGPPREGPGRGRGRGEGGRRRGERRAYAGFGDELERAYCAAFYHAPPPGFPVQHRTGAATLRPAVVARREGAVLLCDGAHPGNHRWPDGEAVPVAPGAGTATPTA